MGTVKTFFQSDTGRGMVVMPLELPQRTSSRQNPLAGAFVALLLFMLIYCSRLQDWVPGLSHVPLAKFAGIVALVALVFSLRYIRQRLPMEVVLLFLLVGQMFLASAMSPVWRGGAFQQTLDFAKVLIVVIVMNVAVTSPKRLRGLMLIQAASVAMIAAVSVWKGSLIAGRLEGTLSGSYADPNDLALAIIISLPLCLALLFLSRSRVWKMTWAAAMLVMVYCVFLTGSRGGFLSFMVVAAVCLWTFAIRGRRRYLLVLTVAGGLLLWLLSSGTVVERLAGTFSRGEDTSASYSSAQQRQELLVRSIDVTVQHPLFGVGPGNFPAVSGSWHTTHNSFTLMSSEGGIPAFILYVLILWCGFSNLRATRQLLRGQAESSVLAQALYASLAGYVVGSFFLSVSYQFFPYILVAYTTVLFSMTVKSSARSKAQVAVCQAEPLVDASMGEHATVTNSASW
jgi:putative inorganic carbon (HCO3(-)) transporter